MNLSIELYPLPNNYANGHTLLLNRAFSAYYAQYRYRSPINFMALDKAAFGPGGAPDGTNLMANMLMHLVYTPGYMPIPGTIYPNAHKLMRVNFGIRAIKHHTSTTVDRHRHLI